MSATWFVGDLHFGHEKVSGLRGFGNTEAHDDSIARQWHKQVKPDDLVYVLGDISGGSRTGEAYALTVLNGLPGRKRLIAGNHDSVASIHRTLSPHIEFYNGVFERVSDFGRVKLNRQDILLSHYPYASDHEDINPRYMQYRLRDLGAPLIHAHTHSTERENGLELCVSWEAWNRLVNLGDVAQWASQFALSPDSRGTDE
jgi:calcineurin-like phosphoesterase family protein